VGGFDIFVILWYGHWCLPIKQMKSYIGNKTEYNIYVIYTSLPGRTTRSIKWLRLGIVSNISELAKALRQRNHRKSMRLFNWATGNNIQFRFGFSHQSWLCLVKSAIISLYSWDLVYALQFFCINGTLLVN